MCLCEKDIHTHRLFIKCVMCYCEKVNGQCVSLKRTFNEQCVSMKRTFNEQCVGMKRKFNEQCVGMRRTINEQCVGACEEKSRWSM